MLVSTSLLHVCHNFGQKTVMVLIIDLTVFIVFSTISYFSPLFLHLIITLRLPGGDLKYFSGSALIMITTYTPDHFCVTTSYNKSMQIENNWKIND